MGVMKEAVGKLGRGVREETYTTGGGKEDITDGEGGKQNK